MERPAFQKLTAFMAELEARKLLLWGREQEIIRSLATQEAGLDEAIITGSHQAIQEQIANLKTELANIQRERYAVTNPPRDGILRDLTTAVWEEATDQITGPLRAEWNAELTELEKAKTMFLAAVGTLGNIKARADSITSRATEALLAIPGLKMAVPSLSTNIIIRHDRKSGAIFIEPQEIEKTFKGGK